MGPNLDNYDNDYDDDNSFINHDQEQIYCYVHCSKILNLHNAAAENIPFIWHKFERKRN